MLFKNEYFFLSNFYPTEVSIKINEKTLVFKNVEAAFQAQKNFNLAEKFTLLKGLEAKRLGEQLTITTGNWNEYQLYAMADALHSKFSNYSLLFQLKLIKDDIIQDNYWNDLYWGKCKGEGKNMLGKLLMNIRDNNNNKELLYRYIQTELLKD